MITIPCSTETMENDATEAVSFAGGWDSAATLVDGRWVERRPRRSEVTSRLRMEARLMPWLAPQLPLAVPEPQIAQVEPLVVRHALVTGEPIDNLSAENGFLLGVFLRALHAVDVAEAASRSLPTAQETARDRAETVDRFRSDVLVLIPARRRDDANTLLNAIGGLPTDTVVHGDLGPEHVLCAGGCVAGVIDFSDAHVGDGAIDLAWALYGTPPEFSCALEKAYGVSTQMRDRALLWHQLGPWYEVVHGLDNAQPADVQSGLEGILRRLRR
jgi:aminoglycoside phosphotransferase (APT) family kinase protein